MALYCAEDWKWEMLGTGAPTQHIHIHTEKCYIHHKLKNGRFFYASACVGAHAFCVSEYVPLSTGDRCLLDNVLCEKKLLDVLCLVLVVLPPPSLCRVHPCLLYIPNEAKEGA